MAMRRLRLSESVATFLDRRAPKRPNEEDDADHEHRKRQPLPDGRAGDQETEIHVRLAKQFGEHPTKRVADQKGPDRQTRTPAGLTASHHPPQNEKEERAFEAGLVKLTRMAGFGPAARSRVALWSAATAVTFALFFQSVHLGHDIVRGDIGTFRSRYTETRLADIGRERAARWSAQPPLERRRLSREDQFLTEGLWHVQERNRASSAGDLLTAWRENAILETFYTPVLDTASYSSATGHRWSPEQRVAAEAAAAAASASDRSPYVSDAYPFPLYAWPFRGF